MSTGHKNCRGHPISHAKHAQSTTYPIKIFINNALPVHNPCPILIKITIPASTPIHTHTTSYHGVRQPFLHYQKSADNTAAWIADASYRPEQGRQQKSPSKSMEGNMFNTTCTKNNIDNPNNKHIHPPTPRVVTPTCSPVSTPTSDGHDVQLGNNIDNKFGMLQSGHTINGINTMHHRTDHNNINNNDTIDTEK